MRLISRTLQIADSPIGTAHAIAKGYRGQRPIIDLSQGTPNYATAVVIVWSTWERSIIRRHLETLLRSHEQYRSASQRFEVCREIKRILIPHSELA